MRARKSSTTRSSHVVFRDTAFQGQCGFTTKLVDITNTLAIIWSPIALNSCQKSCHSEPNTRSRCKWGPPCQNSSLWANQCSPEEKNTRIQSPQLRMRRLKVKIFELTRDWRFSSGCRSTRLWTGSGAKSTSSPGRGNWRWCARTTCNRRKRSMPRRTGLSHFQLTTTNNRGQRFELWQNKPPPPLGPQLLTHF